MNFCSYFFIRGFYNKNFIRIFSATSDEASDGVSDGASDEASACQSLYCTDFFIRKYFKPFIYNNLKIFRRRRRFNLNLQEKVHRLKRSPLTSSRIAQYEVSRYEVYGQLWGLSKKESRFKNETQAVRSRVIWSESCDSAAHKAAYGPRVMKFALYRPNNNRADLRTGRFKLCESCEYSYKSKFEFQTFKLAILVERHSV